MTSAPNRLQKYGVLGLAGIAILGWIREPERHFSPIEAASTRATFQYRPPAVPETVVSDFSGYAVEVVTPINKSIADGARYRAKPAATLQQSPSVPAADTQGSTPANESRHEAPAGRITEQANAGVSDPVAPQAETVESIRRSREDRILQRRSTRNSAMIIAGAAAAGAAIGGLAGGRKGAAIGAVTAGVGGYVYDRRTARDRGASNPRASARDRNRPLDDRELDDRELDDARLPRRFTSRFATPGFAR